MYAYTSDGITEELSNSIYDKIYYLRFVSKHDCRVSILPHRRVKSLATNAGAHRLSLVDLDTEAGSEVEGDIVVMATGYRDRNSSLLGQLFPAVQSMDDLIVRDDYSVDWPHAGNRIFIQNGCKGYFGLATRRRTATSAPMNSSRSQRGSRLPSRASLKKGRRWPCTTAATSSRPGPG